MSHFSHQTSGWIAIESDSSFQWTNADNFYKSLFSSPSVSCVCAQGDEKDWALPSLECWGNPNHVSSCKPLPCGIPHLGPPLNTMKIQASFLTLLSQAISDLLGVPAALPTGFSYVLDPCLTPTAWAPEPNCGWVHLPLCLTIIEGISKKLRPESR